MTKGRLHTHTYKHVHVISNDIQGHERSYGPWKV